MSLALMYAKELITAARAKRQRPPSGRNDARRYYYWLTYEQAETLAQLLRAEGYTRTRRRRVGYLPLERFRPVSDDTFWARLDSVRRPRGVKLYFRLRGSRSGFSSAHHDPAA